MSAAASNARLYDERKRLLIREHGLNLVVIEKSAFVVKSKRILRDPTRDITVVRVHLGNAQSTRL